MEVDKINFEISQIMEKFELWYLDEFGRTLTIDDFKYDPENNRNIFE